MHLWSLLSTFSCLEVGALVEAEHTGKDVLGKASDGGVVGLGRVVEVLAGYIDAVFRAFELGL